MGAFLSPLVPASIACFGVLTKGNNRCLLATCVCIIDYSYPALRFCVFNIHTSPPPIFCVCTVYVVHRRVAGRSKSRVVPPLQGGPSCRCWRRRGRNSVARIQRAWCLNRLVSIVSIGLRVFVCIAWNRTTNTEDETCFWGQVQL